MSLAASSGTPAAQVVKPGYYTVQVNAMDDNVQRYGFPREPILVRAAAR